MTNWIQIIILLGLTASLTTQAFSQQTQLTYCKDPNGLTESKKKHATYLKRTIDLNDGSVATEIRRLSDDRLIRYKRYKDRFPYGSWIYNDDHLNDTLVVEYPLEVEYSDFLHDDAIYFDMTLAERKEVEFEGFVAPRLLASQSFFLCLYSNIFYPQYSREQGYEGTVLVHLKIHRQGQPELVSINQGVEDHLDQEAVRALLDCGLWEPGTQDGEPIDTYTIIPVKFVLE